MIIPIRCMTCGKILADKWNKYNELVRDSVSKQTEGPDETRLLDISVETVVETPEAKALNQLGIKRYCCRRHMLTNVDLIDII